LESNYKYTIVTYVCILTPYQYNRLSQCAN